MMSDYESKNLAQAFSRVPYVASTTGALDLLVWSYRYWRSGNPKAGTTKARNAIECARRDAAANKTRYPRDTGNGLGAASDDGLQWVERPADIGLRFVGFADELAGRAVEHTGWYTREDDSDSVYRGAVYQFPARDGRPVYIAGYRAGSGGRGGWSDECGTESARLELRAPIYGAAGGRESNDDGVRDAARAADGIAETAAEHERDYHAAWDNGRQFAELAEEIAGSRRQFLELRAEIKAAGRPAPETPTICATLRRQCESLLSDIRDAREKREKLREGYYTRETRAAFNEGAGESVFV